MSFLYPRTIAVKRQPAKTGVGVLPYGAQVPADETTIASGLPASIQQARERGAPDGHLPGSESSKAGWNIFVRTPDRTLITEHDVIVDDLGNRYTVVAGYWNSLGYRARAELLGA
jgi:hypothetical protein